MLPSKASPVSAPRSGAPERYRTTWAPRRSANASPCFPTRPTTHCWFWAALGPEYWDELTASRKGSEATSPTQVGELLTAGRHPCWTCRTAMSGGVPTSSSRVPTTDHRPPTTTNITPSSPPTSAGGTPSEAEDPVRARVTDPAVNRMAGPGLRAEPADSRSLCVVVASEIK